MPCAKKQSVNWLDKARFIKRYAVDGCSTTLKVYVETGALAECNMVMGLVNTSPEDFTRFLLRPKGARTARHGIRGLGRNEAVESEELFPDTAKLAADTIHEVTGWHVPTWTELGDSLYEIIKPIEQHLYYLLLATITEDFAFDWYSGILLSPESKCDIGRFAVEGGSVVEESTGYEIMPLSQFLYPMINAEIDDTGVRLIEGTWCIIIHMVAHRDFHGSAAGSIFGKLMVGETGGAQCGELMVLDFPENDFQVFKKVVRKVSAPDLINVQLSVHFGGPNFHDLDYGVNIEAFRIT